MNQKTIILRYLEDFRDWQFEYKVRSLDTTFGFIGARGDRNVRDLLANGLLEGKKEGKYRMVRFKRPEIAPKKEKEVSQQKSLNLLGGSIVKIYD